MPWIAAGKCGIRTLHHQRRVRADEHRNSARTTDRARAALGVDGNVAREHDRVAAVPRARLDPVDRVEERSGTTVARVLRVDALNVRVAVRRKELHEHRLDRLGLVDDRLRTDVEATDRLGVDVVVLHQLRHGCMSAPKAYVPDSANELMSSRSSVKAMYCWPKPMVYLPFDTPSNSSKSASEMHYMVRQ